MCEKVFRQPPLRESLKKSKLRKQDFSVTKQRTALLQVADTIGRKIQYECPGFLSNKRQVIRINDKFEADLLTCGFVTVVHFPSD